MKSERCKNYRKKQTPKTQKPLFFIDWWSINPTSPASWIDTLYLTIFLASLPFQVPEIKKIPNDIHQIIHLSSVFGVSWSPMYLMPSTRHRSMTKCIKFLVQQILHPPNNDAPSLLQSTIPKSQETFGKWVNESTFSNHGFFNFSTSNHFKPVGFEPWLFPTSSQLHLAGPRRGLGFDMVGLPTKTHLPTKIKSCNLKIQKTCNIVVFKSWFWINVKNVCRIFV